MRRGRCRTWGRRCGWCRSRGASACTGAATTLLVPAGDARPALERWYRRRARAEIAPRLDAAVARAGTRYAGLTIRAQRTRWASCSSTGAMSFNWRLLLAPPEVLDYVVEHEVCHLEVMDHSPAFWRLLAKRVAALARARRLAEALRAYFDAVASTALTRCQRAIWQPSVRLKLASTGSPFSVPVIVAVCGPP